MNYHSQPLYIQKALEVAARFGYLRKEFFFQYLSANSRSTKFRNWKILLESKLFTPYRRSFIGEDVYKLSNLAKRVLQGSGIVPVSAAHPLHFEHDDIAIHFALSLKKNGLIKDNYLSEKILRANQQQELISTFGHQPEKLPDLIFEFDLKDQPFRVAVEIERTRKSQFRYDTWVRAYAKAENINLVLLAYNDRSVLQNIQTAIRKNQYPQNIRPIVFCKISEMQKSWTNFPVLINEREIQFETYLKNIRKLYEAQAQVMSDFQSDSLSHSKEVQHCL